VKRSAGDRARNVLARVRPTPTEGRRSLPIRADQDHIRRLWESSEGRAAVLDAQGDPVGEPGLGEAATGGVLGRGVGVQRPVGLERSHHRGQHGAQTGGHVESADAHGHQDYLLDLTVPWLYMAWLVKPLSPAAT
jgi:hypothetical protein